jgi:hypothetical protein
MGSNRSRSVLVTDYAIVTSPTASGWYTIASASIANARGGGSISIGFTGGYFSPRTFTCDFEVDWSGNLNRCNIVNRTNDITKVRIIETGSTTELQAYFDISSSQAENTQNMRVMFTRDKYNPYWSIENPLTQESSPSVTGEEVGNGRGDYFYGADINTFGVYNSNVVFNEHSKDCDFRIETNNNANTLFIEGSTDRVAIGHNDPDTLLHLSGNPVAIKLERPGVRALRMGVPDNSGLFVFADSDDLKSSQRMVIDSNGDIGIGTTSTTHKLTINSNGSTDSVVRIDGDHARGASRYALDVVDDDSNRRGTARFRHTTGSGSPPIIISEGYDHAYIFQSKNTSASDAEQFRIEHYDGNVRINSLRGTLALQNTGGGNIGVGTTVPGALFTVKKDGTQASSVSTTYQIQTVSNSNGGIAIQAGDSSIAYLVFGDNGDYDAGRIAYKNSSHDLCFYTDNTEEMVLDSDGDLHVDRDVVAFSTTPSDKRLKTNIEDINYGLETIMKLNPKQYDWKKDDTHDIGFIAQEVEEVIPEIVKDKKHFDKEIKTLDYEKLTAVLIKAVQEQQQQINKLEEKLNG